MKNNKGITILKLCIIIFLIIIAIFLLFGGNDTDSSTSNSTSSTKSTTSTTKEDRSTYIAKCDTIDYDSLARNPSKYKGNYYKFTGEVIQVSNDDNDVILRVNVTAKKYEYLNETYYEDTILVYYTYSNSYESKILEDDIITFYGQSIGTYTYESIMGASITVPAIVAEYVDIN